MRIVVDSDLCQGHGVCESEAPGIFEVPKGGTVVVLSPEPDENHHEAVRLAVKYCPTTAIRIEET
jgi:ferredoxin